MWVTPDLTPDPVGVRGGGEDGGMEQAGTARMETFSDGVFAIAATLLVLEIGVGTGADQHLGRALIDLWPSYLAYATSFLIIGIIWVNHHECVACMASVDRTMLFINNARVVVNTLVWESGYPLDAMSGLSQLLERLAAPPPRVTRRPTATLKTLPPTSAAGALHANRLAETALST